MLFRYLGEQNRRVWDMSEVYNPKRGVCAGHVQGGPRPSLGRCRHPRTSLRGLRVGSRWGPAARPTPPPGPDPQAAAARCEGVNSPAEG
eukprot:1013322-Prorocentrum_minimum.AAC.1